MASKGKKTISKSTEVKKVATKKVAAKSSPPKKAPITSISSLEEAEKLVNESYKDSFILEYCVLENGHVFYGINKHLGLKHAKRFGLKYFDVKLKT